MAGRILTWCTRASGSTRSSTGVGRGKPARSKSSAPEQTNKQASRRLWQGQSGEQGTRYPVKGAAFPLDV
eukprot:scaffold289899_cov19-Tisochrysis_lutea.AAC.1